LRSPSSRSASAANNPPVFSIVDAALLRPLPFKDSGRLFPALSGSNPKRAISSMGRSRIPAFVELAAARHDAQRPCRDRERTVQRDRRAIGRSSCRARARLRELLST